MRVSEFCRSGREKRINVSILLTNQIVLSLTEKLFLNLEKQYFLKIRNVSNNKVIKIVILLLSSFSSMLLILTPYESSFSTRLGNSYPVQFYALKVSRNLYSGIFHESS